jgi:hypothetical protein
MSFAGALGSGRFVITSEITPPVSLNPQDLLDKVMPLQELAEIDGVAGMHVMAPLNEKAVPALIETARKTLT